MGEYRPGDQVVSITDIGGFAREFVPRGTPGVVIEGDSWFSEPLVRFRIRGVFLTRHRTVDVRVSTSEIR